MGAGLSQRHPPTCQAITASRSLGLVQKVIKITICRIIELLGLQVSTAGSPVGRWTGGGFRGYGIFPLLTAVI